VNYKFLSKISQEDLVERLEARAPHLFEEFRSRPRGDDGKVKLTLDLANRIDTFLINDINRESVKLKQKQERDLDELVRKETDRLAAQKRLQEHVAAGLLNTEKNATLIQSWLSTNANGYTSVSGVDAAISVLRDKLEWRRTAPVVAAPKPQPTVWSPGQPLPPQATEQL
jgi:hypothetical protein